MGQKVYAIGNPFGLAGTMTRGIISSIRSDSRGGGGAHRGCHPDRRGHQSRQLGRPAAQLARRSDRHQHHDCLERRGAEFRHRLCDSHQYSQGRAGGSARYGQVRRPSLGIVSYAIGPDLAEQMGLAADSGVLIQKVIPGGAADRAGLRGGTEQAYVGNTPIMLGGDLIVAIDGQQVTDPQDITAIMDKHQAGDTISITVLRGRRQMTVKLTLGEARGVST